MADMSFIQELSMFPEHVPNADATPDMDKYDDESDTTSNVDDIMISEDDDDEVR
ncbi:hypothetical protein K503DRAFT_803693 [Rhizopogon vinicolor AM-OR11-026]|uniref:Uncharacterized protein n=1 Tax=Rhizopogon vinicolor AM-OR11-026 TaxID=1314800 RepID=A0A1B7MNZ7_9AGAM|nr:hypothetical protein K503DRAFT_803693 [Rhizopogon vinicolor AM-OR11-026]